jgi:hypothetical protein
MGRLTRLALWVKSIIRLPLGFLMVIGWRVGRLLLRTGGASLVPRKLAVLPVLSAVASWW